MLTYEERRIFDVQQWQRWYCYDRGVITSSVATVITSGFTPFHYITPSDDRQTCCHEGVRKCAEAQSAQTAPPAPATVTGWTSDRHFNSIITPNYSYITQQLRTYLNIPH